MRSAARLGTERTKIQRLSALYVWRLKTSSDHSRSISSVPANSVRLARDVKPSILLTHLTA
jgi:hypothetical protein